LLVQIDSCQSSQLGKINDHKDSKLFVLDLSG
jgi:hypothetical protein